MNNILDVSPSKGNQGATRGKEKTSVGIEPTTSGLDLPLLTVIHHFNRTRLSLSDLVVAQSAEER